MDATDRPGEAARIFRRIADAGINVKFSYVAANTLVVIGADDARKASELLGR